MVRLSQHYKRLPPSDTHPHVQPAKGVLVGAHSHRGLRSPRHYFRFHLQQSRRPEWRVSADVASLLSAPNSFPLQCLASWLQCVTLRSRWYGLIVSLASGLCHWTQLWLQHLTTISVTRDTPRRGYRYPKYSFVVVIIIIVAASDNVVGSGKNCAVFSCHSLSIFLAPFSTPRDTFSTTKCKHSVDVFRDDPFW